MLWTCLLNKQRNNVPEVEYGLNLIDLVDLIWTCSQHILSCNIVCSFCLDLCVRTNHINYSCVFGKRNYRVLVRVSMCVCMCVCVCVCVCPCVCEHEIGIHCSI